MIKHRLTSVLLIVTLGFSYSLFSASPIGDFNQLENWTALVSSDELSPHGESTATWSVSGQASFEYTEPKDYLYGDRIPFSDILEDSAVEDWYEYRYLVFWVKLSGDEAFEIKCTIAPLLVGRPDYMKSLSQTATVHGKGWQQVVFSLRDFDYMHHQGTFWKHIRSVSLEGSFVDGKSGNEVLISQPRLTSSKAVALDASIRSKSAQPGETVVYDIEIENESPVRRNVAVILESTAWEACSAKLSQEQLTLDAWETAKVTLSVEMNELVAPGGRENRKVTVIPDGRGDLKEELEFITVHGLPHPYLLHTDAGWQKVKEKADQYKWADQARQRYVDKAERWVVPEVKTGSYNYRNKAANSMMDCAVAWKLTGNDAFAQKVIRMLRDHVDPVKGYPATLKINSGTKVHQGMHWVRFARSYDLLFNHPDLTEEDHQRIEHSLRLYLDWVDYMVLTGDGNNHQVSLVAGAVVSSLLLQDFASVERFLYGTGGYLDLMGAGIMDDGHYFEGTANYNILTANIFNAMAIAFEPWGMDVKNWNIPPKYGKFLMVSDWAMRGDFLGMSFERQGASTRNYRKLKDLWDAVLPMCDYRGVVFPTSDSGAIDLATGGNEGGNGFDLAYYMWRDPAYLPLIQRIERRDLIYGVAELPETNEKLGQESYISDNVGFAVLRSKSEGRPDRERIQAVQRYGTHGGYHGHFDRTGLAHMMRYGRAFYGPEASWYGYWSFMFKMWVQTSNAHNMVVVDNRMQRPNDNELLLFYSGDMMQVSATEIETEWIDPPYGGQTPYALKMPEEKTWDEARWLPTPKNPRPQGDTGTPSEPIMQRRAMIVTDDYVVQADYVKGSEEHDFDNMFNCKGLVGLSADKKVFKNHADQMRTDPYSSAQFITSCDWYETEGTSKASFLLDWSKGEMGGKHSCSEPGVMNVDYYSAWPTKSNVMTGNYAETQNVARHLYYRVLGDGKVLDEGKLAPWILGKVDIDVDVAGVQTLEVETRVEKAKGRKTIFLGNPQLVLANGQVVSIEAKSKSVQSTNVAGSELNRDYEGGKVTIMGRDYQKSIAAEPENRGEVGRLIVDLSASGKKVSRFQATLGGDYPVGEDSIHRKVVATRSSGKEARFLSVIEFHEDNSVIRSIRAESDSKLIVERVDGKTDVIEISGLDGDGDDLVVKMTVKENGVIVATDQTK